MPVKVQYIQTNDVLSAGEYLKRLPQMMADLPPGARAFAADPAHYDFYGPRCVKDLTLGDIRYRDTTGEIFLQLRLLPNPLKHTQALNLSYVGLSRFNMLAQDPEPVGPRLGSLGLDEI